MASDYIRFCCWTIIHTPTYVFAGMQYVESFLGVCVQKGDIKLKHWLCQEFLFLLH